MILIKVFHFVSFLGISAKFRFWANLSELINFYSSWNHQKIYGFLIFQGE